MPLAARQYAKKNMNKSSHSTEVRAVVTSLEQLLKTFVYYKGIFDILRFQNKIVHIFS